MLDSSRRLLAATFAALSISVASAAPLTTDPVWTFTGSQSFSYLARSVSSAGDVNGDGYADVVVGEPFYNVGANYPGRVLVFLGSPVGLSESPLVTILGPGGSFGYSVAGARDINGDKYDDIIVGAPSYSNGQAQEGAAFVYYGQPGGVSTTAAWHFEGDEEGAQLGWSVSSAGNVNGDEFADVIVGSPTFSDGGAAFVFHGSANGLGMTYQWSAVNPEYGEFGTAVAEAGDVNDDGYSDVIVGDPEREGSAGTEAGAASVYLGSANGLAAGPVWTVIGDQEDEEYGIAVAGAGDVNGDGFDDIAVGAWLYDNLAADDEDHGAVFLYYGGAGGPSTSAGWQVTDAEEYSGLGNAVDGAGDVNGDGYADIVISNDYPRARLHLGSASGPSSTPEWAAQNAGQFGESVATAGDVNGDGLADVLIGNPYANFDSQGKAFLYRGVGPTLTLNAFDPNPWQGTGWPSLLSGDHISTDEAALAQVAARPVLGLAADGVTRILLRATVSATGTVEFRITDENEQVEHVGTLSTLGGNQNATTLVANVVTPAPGVNVAFAVLRAPPDFYRVAGDSGARALNVRAEYRQDGSPSGPVKTLALQIVRPPVALLHGLWGSSASWGTPSTGWFLRNDPQFHVVVQDYAPFNANHFGGNVIRAKAAVNIAVRRLRDQGYAATQADVFGHSMGGLLFRLYAAGRRNDYIRDNNYGMGDIHKLITVDTPHQGSELANLLDDIVHASAPYNPTIQYFFDRLLPRLGMCVTCGAVEDLRTDSVEITQLPAVSLPVHALVGVGGVAAQQPENRDMLPGDMAAIARILGTFGVGATLFEGDDHDLIVRKQSQLGGLGAGSSHVSVYGLEDQWSLGLHTTAPTDTSFGARAAQLLNIEVGNAQVFASGFPAGPPPLQPVSAPAARAVAGTPTIGLIITDPAPGTIVTPGGQISVTIAPTAGFVPQRILIESSVGGELLESAPFTTLLDIPDEATGSIVISALGFDAGGAAAVAEEVELEVALNSDLTGIMPAADPIFLFSYAPVTRLEILGDFADGVQRDVTSHLLGTTYASANPSIATVDADGFVTAVDSGTTSITVSNGTFSADVTVDVDSAPLVVRPGRDDIRWPLSADAAAYDVVRGDLGTLRATGDFAAATVACLGRTAGTVLPFTTNPAAGQGMWFLIRVIYGDARGIGSYDSDDAAPPGPRDIGIAASGNDCP